MGREPSLAIIGERYGMASPKGHGVLAEYLTGIVLGTVFIAIFASLIASLQWFDPLALAMGAGMGSGSLMAAASGAIAAQQSPDMAKQVAAFAAASSAIRADAGEQPRADRAMGVLHHLHGRGAAQSQSNSTVVAGPLGGATAFQRLNLSQQLGIGAGVAGAQFGTLLKDAAPQGPTVNLDANVNVGVVSADAPHPGATGAARVRHQGPGRPGPVPGESRPATPSRSCAGPCPRTPCPSC